MSNLQTNNVQQPQQISSTIVTRQIHNRNHHHHQNFHRNQSFRSHHNHHQHHHNHHHQQYFHHQQQQQQQNKTISKSIINDNNNGDYEQNLKENKQKSLKIQQDGDNPDVDQIENQMKVGMEKIRLNYIIPIKDGEHRLHNSWTFWYLKFGPNFDWEHSQIDVATFSTVESFWGVFDRVIPLTETHHGCNYSLFKYGIRPIWEDPLNRNGGRFVFTINKDMSGEYKNHAMELWTEFCMLIVGYQNSMICERICGLVGGNRNNQIKIAIWIDHYQPRQNVYDIGLFLKQLVGYEKSVHFEMHNMEMVKQQQQQQSNERHYSFDI